MINEKSEEFSNSQFALKAYMNFKDSNAYMHEAMVLFPAPAGPSIAILKPICLSPFSKNKREPCVSSFYIKAPCVLVSYSVVLLLDIVTRSYSAISPTSHTSSTTSFLLKRSLLRFFTYFSMSNSFFLS